MGLIVNKLRGDPTLLGDGPRQLEEITGKPVLGITPYLSDLRLPEEDSVALERRARTGHPVPEMALDLAVIDIPALANVDDFDLLEEEPGMSLRYVCGPAELGRPHAVFLPGTKNALAALALLDATGLAARIVQLAHSGGRPVRRLSVARQVGCRPVAHRGRGRA